MQATLKFNLPEERNEHKMALKGSDYYCCLFQLDQELRSFLKYGHEFKEIDEVLMWTRKYINENVNLDEVN